MKNKLTAHHRITKSHWWTNYHQNIIQLRESTHRAVHTLFVDQLPHEQQLTIVDVNWEALTPEFRNCMMEMIWSFDIEEMYNEKCVNMDKLIKKLTER